MNNKKIIPITELGLSSDGKIYVNDVLENIYLIEDHADIVVNENASISVLDKTNSKSIMLESKKYSNVKYLILDSKNSKRELNVNGELELTLISLDKTNESLKINLNSEYANANCKCLSIASGTNNTFKQYIAHNNKLTTSNISNVGVSMNKSDIVFDTTGFVAKAMSQSRCSQLSRGVVMDDVSSVTAKPILLIDEFDCFANHGASIGKMSDEDLFYLMSRGLNKKEAFLLILQGIIQPFISSIEIEDLKNELNEKISNLIEK